ncbi:hypothetical protein [Empedobacter sp. 189-2]|uniref:hypothetical protein n=1 Tax=Empedobacter sp. 189-2 TaxID=2746724 RepID=UPI0025749CB5|nr:hypothetical protein [Empedobacter sp. 189-2]MDM1542371.1 hypothetical protein [Empedobacter sp. 189-2]
MDEFCGNLNSLTQITSEYIRKNKVLVSLTNNGTKKIDLGIYNDTINKVDLGQVLYTTVIDSLILCYYRFYEVYENLTKDISVDEEIKTRVRNVRFKNKSIIAEINKMFPDIRNYRNNVNAHYYRNKEIGSILVDGKTIEYTIPKNENDINFLEQRMIEITISINSEFIEFNEKVLTHRISDNITIK